MTIHSNGVATIDGDTHHGRWTATEGLIHDKFIAGILADLMARHNVKTVIDGGANIGTLTQVFIEAGAKVHAFEPNPEAVECLRHNCPSAKIYEFGLSDIHSAMFLSKQENAGASFLQSVASVDRPTGPLVTVTMLDIHCINPDLIKLDIEGYECHALRGAEKMIRRCRPILFLEVNQGALKRAGESEESLRQILADYGYSTAIVQPDCTWGDPQFDIICYP